MLLTSIDPTEPYYMIDYGDGTSVSLPIAMLSNSIIFNYTYATSGYFNIKITVFNKVSSETQFHSVRWVLFIILKL